MFSNVFIAGIPSLPPLSLPLSHKNETGIAPPPPPNKQQNTLTIEFPRGGKIQLGKIIS